MVARISLPLLPPPTTTPKSLHNQFASVAPPVQADEVPSTLGTMSTRARIAATLIALATATSLAALEGKWTPEQVLRLDPAWLKAQGLELAPGTLWNEKGPGLLAATVNLGGCTAAFVSAEGLLITNHHCAFGILQQHSKPGNDLITNGYLAATRADELSGPATKVAVPLAFTDVTAKVEAALLAGVDDLARKRAIENVGKQLVAECEKKPGRRCQVASYDSGLQYLLLENLEYLDVRLVFAPPNTIGDFGGEVDNWMWPRHTGDFTFLRVYAGPDGMPAKADRTNLPFRPKHFFPVAKVGVKPGDFVMITGFPGRSYRSLTAVEMAERAELSFPRRAKVFGHWLEILEHASKTDEATRIALADRAKGLANTEKNARGQVAGLARGGFVASKRAFEEEVVRWAEARPEHRQAVAAFRELSHLANASNATFERDFLLESARRGPKPLDIALTAVRWARERQKPDLERRPETMERNRERARQNLERDDKRIHPPTEQVLMTDLLTRFAALPANARSAAIDRFVAGTGNNDEVKAKAAAALAGSKVTDLASRLAMFDETPAQLAARRDPLLELAFALDDEMTELEARRDRFEGAAARLRPQWLATVLAYIGKPVSPDANGTLRVAFGHVQGYEPRDGVVMRPQTRLAGLLEKHTGVWPFDAPAAIRDAAKRAASSRWADPALGDVPIDFLADLDTTGGNSGSPVLNGRGELVGANFDRVWENVANDFGFDPKVCRNVSVDIRYVLWVLETLGGENARALLAELGVPKG
jgi:hypothetical protein